MPGTQTVDIQVIPGAGRRWRMPNVRDFGIVIAFIILFVALAVSSPAFLSPANLLNIVNQSAATGIIACALTLVIIAGGFDLSLGGIFAVASIVGAFVINGTGSALLGIAAGVGVGLVLGLLNGVLTTVGRVNSFVATLATSLIFRGFALVITGGFLVVIADQSFSNLSRTPLFGGVRAPILIFIAFALLCGFILNFTVFGRHIFASGGNPTAARLSGVPVNRVRAITYVIAGGAAGLAGLMVASRTLTLDGQAGVGIEFDALAAVLVGGTSIMGGAGAIWRTVLGVMLFALINNGFNLLGVDPLYSRIFTGAIIIIAVGLDAWSRRSRPA